MTTAPLLPGQTTDHVSFAQCHISPEARELALEVMAGGWLTAGQRTLQFEEELARWVGARTSVAVSSCTAAIEMALRALDLRPGSAVLTPTLTFCGAVNAIVHAGLRPVLLDVDEQTLTVNASEVESKRRERPAAMVVQHMAGYPAATQELAEAAGLTLDRVVEDAAHGLGASRDGRAVGTLPSTTCFSFYATKNLPIGEGGALTTPDPERTDRLRVMRQHGMSKDAWRRYEPGAGWRYEVTVDGLKANFTDLQAAIGLGQLAHLHTWQARRAELADRYDAQLGDVPGLVLPPRPSDGRHAWHLYPIRVQPAFGPCRDELIAALAERGVDTSVHFIPVHRFPYFRQLLGDLTPSLPVAERVADQLLSLPLHPHLSDDAVDRVCAQLLSLRTHPRR
ncbi:DegT/DnrJ/EryC1/StrS family aminotransferase [Oryzihumus leptocrescens]|uniref:Perosamine synthetase n=1 Tax=Oryzihumus leptocrescens TaxID=297536 RepID=A0A542Z9B1_9MICO|nr:DegT/DnrJ/EryC1/StrS family aminotransferase [Oryzihumus leptocrescens]TQL56923.1 perosamine synthetase [Oryzihumus leptocrescens]